MLAVCEVKTNNMNRIGKPWRIGKFWTNPDTDQSINIGGWGNYPVDGRDEQRSAG
jgi:hypothetical protein